MPTKKYQKVVENVKEKPVFGVDDLIKKGVPRKYAKTMLYRLKNRGEIFKVERNKYTTQENPLIIAPHLTYPSYLSLWTSLRFHRKTQQSPFGVEVVTSRPRYNRKLEFKETKIQFHKVKPEMMFGYVYEVYEDYRIPIASPEKAIVDGIYLDAIPLKEVKETIPKLEKKKLMDYAARAGVKINKLKEVIA